MSTAGSNHSSDDIGAVGGREALEKLRRLSEAAGICDGIVTGISRMPGDAVDSTTFVGWRFSDGEKGVQQVQALSKLSLAVRDLLAASPAGAGSVGDVLGYVNVYRDSDGDPIIGSTDLYDTAEEAKAFDASEFSELIGVYALVPALAAPPAQAETVGEDARVTAAMDAFYPGENWRVDLGCALDSSLRDMQAAIAAADAAGPMLAEMASEIERLAHALEVSQGERDAAFKSHTYWAGEAARSAHALAEIRSQLDELKPPAQAETAGDAQIRAHALLHAIDVHAEANQYELRADEGDHSPSEFERHLLEDFGEGLMGRVVEVIAPALAATRREAQAGAGDGAQRDEVDTGRLRSSDQLRILAGYHGDKLPPGIGQELCDLADEWDDQVDHLRSAADPIRAGAGDGVVLVPREPTEAMMEAAEDLTAYPFDVWSAMLAAAPNHGGDQ